MEKSTKEHLIELVHIRLNDKLATETVFSDDQIVGALELSLSAFNKVMPKTCLTLDDPEGNALAHCDIIVLYASYILIQGLSIKEKGREFDVEDCGVSFRTPHMGDFLLTVSDQMWNQWRSMIIMIKS